MSKLRAVERSTANYRVDAIEKVQTFVVTVRPLFTCGVSNNSEDRNTCSSIANKRRMIEIHAELDGVVTKD